MLTIFATPKSFIRDTKILQSNAIRSWTLLRPECEIILFGDDEGTAELAAELGIRHIPEVGRNEYGTPLLSSMFSIAQDVAKFELMCHVSADIILMSDFLPAVRQVPQKSFLFLGRRWDVDLSEPIDFNKPDWEAHLRDRVTKEGKLHSPTAIDYYVFPRGLYKDLPPFAVGRTSYDNWLIYMTRAMKVPIIDATPAITVTHQNHDYSHHPQGAAGVWAGPETAINFELTGGKDHLFSTEYATWKITSQGMKHALSMRNIYFRMRALPVLNPRFRFLLTLFKIFERLVRITRSVMPH